MRTTFESTINLQKMDAGDDERAKELQESFIHLLGNLTLTPYNSELAQKPFYCSDCPEQKSKRDYRDKDTGKYVGLRSGLFLNSSIPDAKRGETLENKEHWTIDDIERRNNWFIDLIV